MKPGVRRSRSEPLSSVISDLLGFSGRRILGDLAQGTTDASELAWLGHDRLQATHEQLSEALRETPTAVQQHLLGMYLDHIELIDGQLEDLDRKIAAALSEHQDAVVRLAEVPGLGPDSAQQVIAEMGVQAAVKTKGSFFEVLFRRLVPRLGYNKAIWAVAHRVCRLIWKILHQGVRYIEYGERVSPKVEQRRARKMIRKLRDLRYKVELSADTLIAAPG